MSTKKVLIIEDDHKLNLALALRLKTLGHLVIQAHDGAKAGELASRYEPDLILMDINLPVRDGFSVTESIRSDPRTAAVPIIFITASKKPGLRERAFQLGAAGFLEKPFEQEEIQKAIERALIKAESSDSKTPAVAARADA